MSYQEKTDEELMSDLKYGSSKAFNELYDRFSSSTYGYIINKSKNSSLANDIHQTSWEKVYTKAYTFDTSQKFSSWLFKIVFNCVIDEYRKDIKHAKIQKKLNEKNIIDSQISDKSFEVSFDALKSPYKEALKMKYTQGLDNKAISKRLKVKEPNLRKILSRGLKMIKKNLNHKTGVSL